MLPLAHTYVSTKVTGRKDPLLLFGSVLPDIATTSSGKLNREKIHDSPYEFHEFIKTRYPELSDLALGVLLHSSISKGADLYTDDFETGFAYVHGRYIQADVASLLGTEKDKASFILSHNFIEGALDLLIARDLPEILETYKKAQESVEPHLISKALSEYLAYDQNEIEKELVHFKSFLNVENLGNIDSMTNNFVVPLLKLKLNKDVDKEQVTRILEKAISLIMGSYQDFLNDTVAKMKVTFKEYLF